MMEHSARVHDGSRAGLRRQLAVLAVPLAGTQLTAVVLAATNTAMMGLLGVTALAAGGLSMVIFNQFRTIGTGLIMSVGNEIASSRSLASAAQVVATARRGILRAGLLVATLAGLVGGIAIATAGRLLTLLGQDVDIANAASPLLVALAPGLLPVLWFQVLRQYAIGMGKPQSILAITLSSIVLNVGLSLALTHGWGPLPQFGLTGIGLASTIVQYVNIVALAGLVLLDKTLVASLSFRFWKAARGDVGKILRHGYKISATFGSSSFFYMTIAFLMGMISPLALAAHNVVYQLFSISFQIANGLSQASSIVTSQLSSEKKTHSAAYVNAVSLLSIGMVAGLLGVSYVLFPAVPLALSASDASSDLFVAARALLLVAIGTQLAEGVQNVSVGVLRGFGDTSSSLRFSLLGYWMVGLPAAFLLAFPLRLGAVGIWLGITVGLVFIGTVLQIRIRNEVRVTGVETSVSG
jgi:MATE family multidrug resistance protein